MDCPINHCASGCKACCRECSHEPDCVHACKLVDCKHRAEAEQESHEAGLALTLKNNMYKWEVK